MGGPCTVTTVGTVAQGGICDGTAGLQTTQRDPGPGNGG